MRHVLIVNDALSLGRLLKTALASLDSTISVVVVSSAEDAILEGTRYPLNLLIIDIQIQEILRVDLIRRIRARHPDLGVIVIGGVLDDEHSKLVTSLKAEAYFNKPLNIPEFTAAAGRFLGLGDEVEFEAVIDGDSDSNSTTIPQLVDVLADFRSRSGALAVLLIDDLGKALGQAGKLKQETYERWIPEIMSSATASTHLSRTLGSVVPENAMYISGDDYHLVLTPVYDLVLVTVLGKSSPMPHALLFEESMKIRKTLAYILREVGMASYPTVANKHEYLAAGEISSPATDSGTPEDLTSLFEKEGGSVDRGQADSFWESLPGESTFESNEPDTLSYDQAHRLGFTPEESEEK